MTVITEGHHPSYRDPKTGRFRAHPNSLFSPEGKGRWDRAQRERDLDRAVRTWSHGDKECLSFWLRWLWFHSTLPDADMKVIRAEFARRHAEQVAWEVEFDKAFGPYADKSL